MGVDGRVRGGERPGRLEEALARHREELPGFLRRVVVDGRRLARLDAAAQVLERGPEVPGPRGRVHPPVKRGPAVRVAVEHVELVRHLMDDDVVAVAAPRGLHVLEGEDDRSAEPRLPASLLLPSMLDPRLVHLVPARNEARGIDHHRPPGPVGVEPEGEDRQARLRRDDRDVHRADGLSEHRLDGLSGHEARREVAKARSLIIFERIEDREAVEHRRPVGVVDPSRAAMRPHRGLQASRVSGGHDTRPSPEVSTAGRTRAGCVHTDAPHRR